MTTPTNDIENTAAPEETTTVESTKVETPAITTEETKVEITSVVEPEVTSTVNVTPIVIEPVETVTSRFSGFAVNVKPKSPAERDLCFLIDKYVDTVDNDKGKEADRKAKVLTMRDILFFPSNANVVNSLPLYDILSVFIDKYRNTLVVESKVLQNLNFINNRVEFIRFTTIYTSIKEVVDCRRQGKKFMIDLAKVKKDLGGGISEKKFEAFIAWLSQKEERLNK